MSYLKKTHVSESLLVNLLYLYFKNALAYLKKFHLEFTCFVPWLWYFRGQSSVTVKGKGSTAFRNTDLFGVMVVVLVCFYGTGSHVALDCFQLIRYLRMTFCSWSTPCIWNNLVKKKKEPIGINYVYVLLFSHWKENRKGWESFFRCPTQYLLSCHPYFMACPPLWWWPLISVVRNRRLTIENLLSSKILFCLKQGMSSPLLGSHDLVTKCVGCGEWGARYKSHLIICSVTWCFSICMVEMEVGDMS